MNGQEAVEALGRQMEQAPDGVGIVSFRGETEKLRTGLTQIVESLGTPGLAVSGSELRINSDALKARGSILATLLNGLAKSGISIRDLGTRIVCERESHSTEAALVSAVMDLTESSCDLLFARSSETEGETYEEAMTNIQDAIKLHLAKP